MNAVLKQLNACPCGFPALKDEIKLGARYQIDFDNTIDVKIKCGGCRLIFESKAVFVHGRFGGRGGYLPLGIFRKFTASETLFEFTNEFFQIHFKWPDAIPVAPLERVEILNDNPTAITHYDFSSRPEKFHGIPLHVFRDAPQRRAELLKP
jgi:hypothetical protein